MGQATAPAEAGFVENAVESVCKCSAAAGTIKALAAICENEIDRLRDYMRETAGSQSTAELEDWLHMLELFAIITEKAELIAGETQALEIASYAVAGRATPASAA